MQYYTEVVHVFNHDDSQEYEAMNSCRELDEQVKTLQGQSSTSMSALEMFMVSDVVLPL